ncbi:hypothetical protein F5Y08DRAFT_308983 [Xylaria arbuscula]|nr:hypothetical protein F5Y08DRAFT_308983 [Xylaria arbuscula]
MSAARGNKKLRGCETCRERHLKCDRGDPCSYCAKKGTVCVRPVKWRFRHSCGPSEDEREFQFPSKQKWFIFSGKRLAFIDETVETSTNYGQEDFDFNVEPNEPLSLVPVLSNQEQIASSDLTASPLAQNHAPGTPTAAGAHHGRKETVTSLPSPSIHRQLHPVPFSLDQDISSPEDALVTWHRPSVFGLGSKRDYREDSYHQDNSLIHGICHPSLSCLGICEPLQSPTHIFPLRDFREAESIQYYASELAPNFDLYDREKNFARGIIEAVGERPILMGIISNLATKHRESFHVHRSSRSETANRPWCTECLRGLVVTNNHMLDGCVLASIVLLRFSALLESLLDVKSLERDCAEACNILETQAEFLLPRGLHQAAFWAGVRQEIYLAILHQRSTNLCFDRCNIDRSSEEAEDEVWIGRIILHLVDVLEYCFGPQEMDTYAITKYENLIDYSTAWAATRPGSFEPIFIGPPPTDNPFPEVIFLGDCAMEAWNFYHLSRMLLIAHTPALPRMGRSYIAASQSISDEIKSDVQILCGIAETQGNAYCACPAAILGIVLAGDRFTDRRQQEALLNFLIKTEESSAWPTWSIQQEMKETWGWSPDNGG